jgi:hypothetical protein
MNKAFAQAPETEPAAVYIRGPALRKRWAMPHSTFYDLRARGVIPEPEYPFGPAMPVWRLATIEAFERKAETKPTAQAPQPTRGRGRPRKLTATEVVA